MSRKNRRKKRRSRHTSRSVTQAPANPTARKLPKLFRYLGAGLMVLLGSGFAVYFFEGAYRYFAGDVSVEFLQPIDRAYEFQLRNDTPFDHVITRFRVVIPKQEVVYVLTESVYARLNEDGTVALPPGTDIYVPAAEFNELDGHVLPASAPLKFRLPPLSSRPLFEPEALVVDVQFELEPTSAWLRRFDWFLELFGARANMRTSRFLVINNYWTPTTAASVDEAIRVRCRDNAEFAQTTSCKRVL